MNPTITQHQKDVIIRMVADLIDTASRHYGQAIEMPTVTFNATGTRVAGWAKGRAWHVNFHSGFVAKFFEEYITETVAHEVAHLIDFRFNPETRAVSYVRSASGKLRRTKRSIHGETWKWIMRHVFNTSPNRTHNWTLVDPVEGQPTAHKAKSPYVYACSGCGHEFHLGVVRHRKLVAGAKYFHRGCDRKRFKLVFSRLAGDTIQLAASTQATTTRTTPPTAPTGSKSEGAQRILAANRGLSKSQLVSMLMEQLNMTVAGANTYYYKYK